MIFVTFCNFFTTHLLNLTTHRPNGTKPNEATQLLNLIKQS